MGLPESTAVKENETLEKSGETHIRLLDWLERTCENSHIRFNSMAVAADIMSKRVKTLTMDHTVKAAVELMEKNRIRHVPIFDEDPERGDEKYFVGVISQRDILRLSYEDKPKNAKDDIDSKSLRQLLSQIISRNPFSVGPQTPIPEVITMMIDHHVDLVPVLDEGLLVGLITTADIIELYVKLDKVLKSICVRGTGKSAIDLSELTEEQSKVMLLTVHQMVHEVMAKDVACIAEEDTIGSVTILIQENRIRHAPVLNEEGQMIGIVSDRDVLKHLPFAGRRPLHEPKKFRATLFRKTPNQKASSLTIGDIMTRRVKHVPPSSTVRDVADLMCKHKISCLPVLDNNKNLRGSVTVTDIMKMLLGIYQL